MFAAGISLAVTIILTSFFSAVNTLFSFSVQKSQMSMTLKVFCGSATNFDGEKTLLLKRYETAMNYKGRKYTNRIFKFKIYAMAL